MAASTPGINELCLWYREPAVQWDHAMPIGNGRLGAMIFGGLTDEKLQLNEETIWSGGYRDTNNSQALESLSLVRQLVVQGKVAEASEIAEDMLLGVPKRVKPYEPLGNLLLNFPAVEAQQVQSYHRWLDLKRAVACVDYEVDGVQYTREYFASSIDQAIIIRLTASKPGMLTVGVQLERERDAAAKR
ncbi:MAG: glycoside hydrolase family 95 protein, partial [Bacilli bacterium]|nr:glycoside hydrolase family 95 protein [Bacilli bacterium]